MPVGSARGWLCRQGSAAPLIFKLGEMDGTSIDLWNDRQYRRDRNLSVESYTPYARQLAFDFVSDFTSIAYQEELQKLGSRFFYIPPKGRHLFQHWRQLWSILRQHPEYRTVYFNILDAGCAFTEFIPWLLGRKIVTHSHNSDTEKKRLHRICRPFLNIFTKEYVACSQVAAEYMFGSSKRPALFRIRSMSKNLYSIRKAADKCGKS